MKDVRVVRYSERWEQAHIDFAKKYWSKTRRFSPEYIYWKYNDRNEVGKIEFYLAIKNKEVVGQLGLISAKIVLHDKTYLAKWRCDLMVDEKYRGKGVAKLLYENIEKSNEIILSSNPSSSAEKSIIKNGYKLIPGPFSLLLPVSIGGTLMLKNKYFRYLRHLYNPILIYMKMKFYENEFKALSIIEVEELISSSRKKIKLPYVIHDHTFLSWRCSTYLDYYKGMEMFKLKESSNSYIMFCPASRCLYVTNINYDNIRDLYKLVSYVALYSKRNRLLYVKFLANTSQEKKDLKRIGMIEMSTQMRLYYKCHLLSNIKGFYYTLMDCDENI